MTQKLRYFCTLLLMAVVGVAWADEELAYTLQPASGTNNSYANNCNIEIDGITWNLTGNSTIQPWRIGGKSLSGVDRELYSKTAIEDNITKIEVTHGNASSITINSWTLVVASDASFNSVVSTLTPTFTANATATITRPDGVDWSGCYYKFIYNVTVSGSSNKFVEFTQAKFYKDAASADAPSITADNVNIAYDAEEGVIAYTVNNPVSGGSVNATTTADWISFGPSFNSPIAFTCSANDGAERTATVTLTYSYDNQSVTKNVTVTQAGNPNRPGTENNPYTVAQAIQAIDDANQGTVSDVYVAGIVSQVDSYNNGQITYWISDDGTTTNQFEVYRGKGIGGANFTSQNDVKVGDEVVVKGNITYYANGGVYEFAANNQLVSLNRPVSEDPAITLDDYTIDVPVEGGEGILTVDYQNIDEVIADIQFYDATGAEVDANEYEVWLTAELDEDNNVNYLAIENNGEERTAYFKVFALVGEEYVYSDLITITQEAYVAPSYAVLPFSYNDGRANIEDTDGLTQEGLGNDYASSPKLRFDTTGDWMLLQFDEEPGKLTFDIKGNSFSGGTFTVQTSEDGVTFTELASYTELGATQNVVFTDLGANVRFIKWIYTEKVSGNVALGNIKLEKPATSATITIKDGFKATTFSCDKALDFTGQNIAAYIIIDENGKTEQVTMVPANTGLYIVGAEGDYEVPFLANEEDAEDMTGNLLVGTISEPVNTKTLEGNYTYYLFGKQNGKEAFFKVGESTPDAKATASAGKAYLAVPGAGNAKEMIVIGGDVTGIESIENGTIVNDNYYTIDGKLVKGQPTQKGIYVVNGRKVVIK